MANTLGNKQKSVAQVKPGPLSKGKHKQPAKRLGGRAIPYSKQTIVLAYDFFIRYDGTIIVKQNTLQADRFYLERYDFVGDLPGVIPVYEFVISLTRNKHGLLALPDRIETNRFKFNYTGSPKENYISEKAFAALIGALDKAGFCDFSLNHWSNSDGTSPNPSKSHKNGVNGDIRPLRTDLSGDPVNIKTNAQAYDVARNQRLVDTLREFGWKNILFFKNPKTGYIPNGTTHDSGHYDHFHVQGFSPKILIYKQ